ncbi:MAG TPA: hypothetical protein VHG32_16560 [Thermoanaerobaculia bacterium]|jgi:hypothetical protein|nr:hypothetical protein [Thermoanaerobaculia bacterium]
MKIFFGILGAGAFGGALSWVYSITLGLPLHLGGTVAVLASILLGAGAAVLGVYVLANTDLGQVGHALAFAVLCGFSWQIIYQAGQSTVNRLQARDTVASGAKSTEITAQQLAAAPAAKKDEVAKELAGQTTSLLTAAEKADSKEAEKKAASVSISALQALGQTPPSASPQASAAAEQIAEVALDTGNGPVAKKAIETLAARGVSDPAAKGALQRIETVARRNSAEDIANLARTALKPPSGTERQR